MQMATTVEPHDATDIRLNFLHLVKVALDSDAPRSYIKALIDTFEMVERLIQAVTTSHSVNVMMNMEADFI